MQEQTVEFFSDGSRMSGILRTPDDMIARCPAIVQGPGWLGLKDAKELVESAPKPIKEGLDKAEAEKLAEELRGVGALEVVDLRDDRDGVALDRQRREERLDALESVRAGESTGTVR